jgi:hypothetical protein
MNKKLNLQEFINFYVAANTPKYLYNRFRSNEILFNFAKNNSIGNLAKEYNMLTNKPERSLEEVVRAYFILMSLTFLPYNKGIEAFKHFDLSNLDWGNDIFEIYKTTVTNDNITTFTIKPALSGKGEALSSEANNNSLSFSLKA